MESRRDLGPQLSQANSEVPPLTDSRLNGSARGSRDGVLTICSSSTVHQASDTHFFKYASHLHISCRHLLNHSSYVVPLDPNTKTVTSNCLYKLNLASLKDGKLRSGSGIAFLGKGSRRKWL